MTAYRDTTLSSFGLEQSRVRHLSCRDLQEHIGYVFALGY